MFKTVFDLLHKSWNVFENFRKDVKVEKIIPHEDFNSPKELSNDIALLKLAEHIDLNVLTPACLPALDTDFTGKTGSVYGEKKNH